MSRLREFHGRTRYVPRWLMAALPVVLTVPLVGCQSRTLVITQADRINTAMQLGRALENQTGEPLELTVVCVKPEDLEKQENSRLSPDSLITSKEWYEFRPEGGVPTGGRFDIPDSQIYVLTNKNRICGQVRGPALRGAIEDGTAERFIKGISFGRKSYSKKSAIYVFPKFIDRNGAVLPVPPVRFSPPAAYSSTLRVEIGVEPGGPHDGQYLRRVEKR